MRKMTYGADPELFLIRESDGSTVPVCNWLGGDKDAHVDLKLDCGGAVHEDGCALELTFNPTNNVADMISRASYVRDRAIRYANSKYREANKGTKDTVWLYNSPFALFTNEQLDAAGPKAKTFGCSPEYDSYLQGERALPMSASILQRPEGGIRFAGGHIHLGYRDVHPEISEYVVAMLCDLTIGLKAVAHGEKQGDRRRFYGQAGRFRPTKYGVEYRTPSNMWLYNGMVQEGVWAGLNVLTELMKSSEKAIRAKWNAIPWRDVQRAIRDEDTREANNLFNALAA